MPFLGAGATFVGDALLVSGVGVPSDNLTLNGAAFTSTPELIVTSAPPAVLFYPNGLPTDELGRVYIVDKAAAVAPLIEQQGLKTDANGALVTVDIGAAVAPFAGVGRWSCDADGALITV